MDRKIVLIIHNVRSCHNVGALIRTAEGLAISHVYLTGYTPYPMMSDDDPRLPHIATKINSQINKTALGAENTINWSAGDVSSIIRDLRLEEYQLVALEQANTSTALPSQSFKSAVALLVGNEVDGLDDKTLSLCDIIVDIPMLGRKESFNVSAAAAMALYHLRFC